MSDTTKAPASDQNSGMPPTTESQICGIVMPISETDGCSATHWSEVLSIISESILSAGFKPNLVSNSEEVNFIHRTIVRNLYQNPIVVCDVSGKNPNVMFELGIRLTFDLPTVIIKDDVTKYAFDTQIIEHVPYLRDLRYASVNKFKIDLERKIRATYDAKLKDPNFSQFLKHIGPITTPKMDTKELPQFEYLSDKLSELSNRISDLSDNIYSRKDRKKVSYGLALPYETEYDKAITTYIESVGLYSLIRATSEKIAAQRNSNEIPVDDLVEYLNDVLIQRNASTNKSLIRDSVKHAVSSYYHLGDNFYKNMDKSSRIIPLPKS